MLHGRLVAGLVAAEIEANYAQGDLRLARLTIDLFRVAPMQPVRLTVEPVRDGRRIRCLSVDVDCQDRLIARASALVLAAGPAPPGSPWSPPVWSTPEPESLPASPRTAEADAMGSPDLRFLSGALAGPGPHHAWLREPCLLVEGETLSPGARAVMAADVANPLTNWSGAGLQYINADVSVHLVRPPAGEWIGLEVVGHLREGGISAGNCRLHDRHGPFGETVVAGVARAFPST